MSLLGGPEFNRLHRAIGAAELRQRVIANNVANVDTPYFKRSEVVFENLLEREMGVGDRKLALQRTYERHIPLGGAGGAPVQPTIVTDNFSVMNNNVNNVDIDREMSLQAKNQLRYNALIQQLNHEFRMIRTAVEGRA